MKIRWKKERVLASIALWLLYFIYTQVVITLIALPILVSWGLGISYMTLLGNFFFTPFLSFFLLLSSLIFCTELLSLPNNLLLAGLEFFTTWWHWLLSLGSPSWIIYFAKPPTLVLMSIPLMTFGIIRNKQLRLFPGKFITCLILLVIVIISLNCWTYYRQHCDTFIQVAPHFVIKNTKNRIRVIDTGFLNRKKSLDKCIEFELKPVLVTHFGTPIVDELVLQTAGTGSLAAALVLCKNRQVRTIFLPYFETLKDKTAWAHFFALKAAAQENNIKIIRTTTQTTYSSKDL